MMRIAAMAVVFVLSLMLGTQIVWAACDVVVYNNIGKLIDVKVFENQQTPLTEATEWINVALGAQKDIQLDINNCRQAVDFLVRPRPDRGQRVYEYWVHSDPQLGT